MPTTDKLDQITIIRKFLNIAQNLKYIIKVLTVLKAVDNSESCSVVNPLCLLDAMLTAEEYLQFNTKKTRKAGRKTDSLVPDVYRDYYSCQSLFMPKPIKVLMDSSFLILTMSQLYVNILSVAL